MRDNNKIEYKNRYQYFKKRYDDYCIELSWKDNSIFEQRIDIHEANTSQFIKQAADIQNYSKDSLNRTIAILENTKNIGGNTLVKIGEQTERLERINGGLNETNTELKTANRSLRAIARKIGTDKCIICFILLVLVGIVIVILYKTNVL